MKKQKILPLKIQMDHLTLSENLKSFWATVRSCGPREGLVYSLQPWLSENCSFSPSHQLWVLSRACVCWAKWRQGTHSLQHVSSTFWVPGDLHVFHTILRTTLCEKVLLSHFTYKEMGVQRDYLILSKVIQVVTWGSSSELGPIWLQCCHSFRYINGPQSLFIIPPPIAVW